MISLVSVTALVVLVALAAQADDDWLASACVLAGLLLAFFGRALNVRAATAEPYDRALLLGVAAALVSILLGSWLISFVVRGIQLVVIALFAMPAAVHAEIADSSVE